MKENQNLTVVCEHCGQPHEVAVKRVFLFYEEWKSGEPRSYTHPKTGQTIIVNRYNLSKEEWRAAKVTKSRDEFIRELHERVEHLEAALAEKGGER